MDSTSIMKNYEKAVLAFILLIAIVGIYLPLRQEVPAAAPIVVNVPAPQFAAPQEIIVEVKYPDVPESLGGTLERRIVRFVGGLFAGSTDQFSVSSTGDIDVSRLVQGGTVLNITSGSEKYSAAQWCDNMIVTNDLSGVASTANATTPLASALIADCIPTVGDSYRFLFRNISNDAGEVVTLVASTSVDFRGSTIASGSNMLELSGGEDATIDVINYNGTTVIMNVISNVVAD